MTWTEVREAMAAIRTFCRMIRHSRSQSTAEAGWLKGLLERRPARLVSVAQANKTARIVWAVLVRGEAYRMPAAVPAGAA